MESISTWDTRFRDDTKFWVQFVFVPVVVITGVLGNSVTIYILTRKQMRLSSKVYLTALTISDLIFLLSSFSMTWKHYDCMKSVEMYWKYIPFGIWITDATSSTSVWITVIFTIERYLAICHPILTKCYSPSTERRAATVASGVYMAYFLLTATTSFEWETVITDSQNTTLTNSTVFAIENTSFGKNSWYRLIYRSFSTIFFVLLPLGILIVGNVFLINAVRASHKIREGLVSCYVHRHQAQKMCQQDKITINLIIIIIVFFICQLPTAAILIYTSMHTPLKDSVEENVLLGLGHLFNLLIAINAECNFILYTAISDKFRKSLLTLFRIISSKNSRNAINGLESCAIEQDSRKRDQTNSTSLNRTSSDFASDIHRRRNSGKYLIQINRCTTCEVLDGGIGLLVARKKSNKRNCISVKIPLNKENMLVVTNEGYNFKFTFHKLINNGCL